MLAGLIDDLTKASIDRLVAERRTETSTLEFKAKLPGNKDDDVREFLKDVAAMANSAGGDIVYGVGEVEGVAGQVLPEQIESADDAIRRLSQRLDDCIEPRLHGRRLKAIEYEGGYVLVLRVPHSHTGPHRTSFRGQHRFPLRNEANITDMTYEQLRTAFDKTATLSERARAFRSNRLIKIGADEGARLEGQGSVVLHVIPLKGMAGSISVDVVKAYRNYAKLALDFHGISRALNLDGVLVYQSPGDGSIMS